MQLVLQALSRRSETSPFCIARPGACDAPSCVHQPRGQRAVAEPGHGVGALAEELRQMQGWLALDRIEVAERGDLAAELRRA